MKMNHFVALIAVLTCMGLVLFLHTAVESGYEQKAAQEIVSDTVEQPMVTSGNLLILFVTRNKGIAQEDDLSQVIECAGNTCLQVTTEWRLHSVQPSYADPSMFQCEPGENYEDNDGQHLQEEIKQTEPLRMFRDACAGCDPEEHPVVYEL